jgi:hypothetical protein
MASVLTYLALVAATLALGYVLAAAWRKEKPE